MGTVLVPNSSPLPPDSPQRGHQQYQQINGYDVASKSSATYPNSWASSFGLDPLSAPSSFVSNGGGSRASLRRPWDVDGGSHDITIEEGPPRKRLNRGSTHDEFDLSTSPPSPEIQRPGQRRRVPTEIDLFAESSDESLPDLAHALGGPSKPRLVRTRPAPSPDPPASSDLSNNPKFIRFKVTMPLESPSRVQSAWQQADGDVKRATELLSDPSWVPKLLVTVRPQTEVMGRVKEIDEATKAQRVATKEKGKKSMIYANRTVLENNSPRPISTPPPSKSLPDTTLPSPSTPVIALPRRKRIKKMVLDSDSEVEVDSDDDQRGKRSRVDVTNETRALDYFNTTGSEALQELTGSLKHYPQKPTHAQLFKVAVQNKLKPLLIYGRSSQSMI